MQKISNFTINKLFYKKFIGLFFKKGNRTLGTAILNKAFFAVQTETLSSISLLLLKIWNALNVFVEVRKVHAGKKVHLVPFPIKVSRRISLAFGWILKAIAANKKKVPLTKKVVEELLLLHTGGDSKALELMRKNILEAKSNRSNLHFRW